MLSNGVNDMQYKAIDLYNGEILVIPYKQDVASDSQIKTADRAIRLLDEHIQELRAIISGAVPFVAAHDSKDAVEMIGEMMGATLPSVNVNELTTRPDAGE